MLYSLLTLLSSAFFVRGCVNPSGLEPNDVDSFSFPDEDILPMFKEIFIDAISRYEGPTQFRLVQLSSLVTYSTVAAYEPYALDHYGRVAESNSRRRCVDSYDYDFLDFHRKVALAYALFFGMSSATPEARDDFAVLMESFGLNSEICDVEDCSDVSTPWGLACVLTDDMRRFADFDGWNEDGSLSRDYNKIPYQDWRTPPYTPQNSPWAFTPGQTDRWQPLLESDMRAFNWHQEHVTPHIGFTGKSILLGDDEICSRQVPDPNMDYQHEIEVTLERLEKLTDKKKLQVEFFDSKLKSLVPLLAQYYRRNGVSLDSFEYIFADSIIINVLYEVTMIAWKEKVRHDLVRPPSVAHHLLAGQYVRSYAGRTPDGRSFGTQTLLADDWEPYIRTMPHAEYPSGSSCQCKAYEIAMTEITGSNNINVGPLEIEAPAFSSFLEPLSTPAEDVVLEYDTWRKVSNVCGRSRLNGGMHFTPSVPAGRRLCGSVGKIITNRFNDLKNGRVPDYVVDIDNPVVFEDRCSRDYELIEEDFFPFEALALEIEELEEGSNVNASVVL